MLNFLPQKNRKQIILEYLHRVFSLLLQFFFVINIILITFFMPSYFYAKYKNNTINDQLLSLQDENATKGEDPVGFMKNINKLSIALSNDQNFTITYNDIVDKIISYKDKDIKIQMISISQEKNEDKKVQLSGIAKTRDSLTSFSTNMKTDGFFSSVVFPVSNFLKSSDLEFSATLIYKNK